MSARQVSILLSFIISALIRPSSAWAQEKTLSSTICEVSKDPGAFDNKFVRLRGTLAGNFEISAIRDAEEKNCGSLWFTYPGSGPEASVSISSLVPTQPRPAVQLKHDKEFHRFQKSVDAKMYARRRDVGCMDCPRFEVTAVMVGLIEFAGPGHGFGHMNAFKAQFVLQSIEQTSVKDLASNYNAADFSTTPTRFPTGYLSGTLVDPDGRPIANGDLTIYSAIDETARIDDDSDTTDKKGRFKFAVPPGSYVIGFNTFWPPSPKDPFPPTYYPSAPEKSEARVVVVADRQHVGNLVLRLPRRLVARTIPIKVSWPDGNPVADANVWLSQLNDPTAVVGMSVSHTDDDGSFDLIGFVGINYILHADKYASLAHVSCAKNLLIRASDPVPARIQLSLTITDFDICKNIDFEIPTDASANP